MRVLIAAAIAGAALSPLSIAASASAPSSPNFDPSGKLVPGHYACRELPNLTLAETTQFNRSKFTSQFDIAADGTYTYRGAKPQAGTYAFDPATSSIEWKTGPYAPDANGSVLGHSMIRKSDGKPVIVLTFKIPKFPDSLEYCALLDR